MSLETELKKSMGYTKKPSPRCDGCTHGIEEESSHVDRMWKWFCTANAALKMPVSSNGRCDLFSAKRPRKSVVDDPTGGAL